MTVDVTLTLKFGNETAHPVEVLINPPEAISNCLKVRMIATNPDIQAASLDEITTEAALVDIIDRYPTYFAQHFVELFDWLIANNCGEEVERIVLRDGVAGETLVGIFGDKSTFVVDADDVDEFIGNLCNKLGWSVDCIDDLRGANGEEAA